jgi:hypothetical protein
VLKRYSLIRSRPPPTSSARPSELRQRRSTADLFQRAWWSMQPFIELCERYATGWTSKLVHVYMPTALSPAVGLVALRQADLPLDIVGCGNSQQCQQGKSNHNPRNSHDGAGELGSKLEPKYTNGECVAFGERGCAYEVLVCENFKLVLLDKVTIQSKETKPRTVHARNSDGRSHSPDSHATLQEPCCAHVGLERCEIKMDLAPAVAVVLLQLQSVQICSFNCMSLCKLHLPLC